MNMKKHTCGIVSSVVSAAFRYAFLPSRLTLVMLVALLLSVFRVSCGCKLLSVSHER